MADQRGRVWGFDDENEEDPPNLDPTRGQVGGWPEPVRRTTCLDDFKAK